MKAFIPVLSLVFCLAAAAGAQAYEKVLIEGVPHVRQKPDFCGEACVEMALRKLGSALDQDAVFDQAGLDPLLGRGCYTRELNQAMLKIGFRPGDVFAEAATNKLPAAVEAQWKALHADLRRGIPSIVCMYFRDGPGSTEHFRLVLGYDPESDEVVFHEPAEPEGAYRRMKRDLFLKLWPLRGDAKSRTVIRLRCDPGPLATPAAAPGFTAADYAQAVRAVRERVPAGESFPVRIEAPFVVTGDLSNEDLARFAEHTVRWAAKMLKQDFFPNDPGAVISVWLFRDKPSYERHTKEIFGDEPTTPFGYFSDKDNALIMNIATGGGTLVHEMVHPFMRAHVAKCPAWLNEGLASLYEQSCERAGRIRGLTNWRLAGLQDAIRAGTLPSFEALAGMTDNEFYDADKGSNYAQARYLCYYLQERKLLVPFFKKYRDQQGQDPSGFRTLQAILGEKDMAAFQKTWEAFVLTLRFPEKR